ncbi:TlpA family protein disulfide reductase [Thermoflexus sp.]|uniref:TlpA family protein disulfide reductase n=1 Tax=Thermoflexus sp. TaxID=1969742 RepID=UPI0025E9969D|nr:TlpA disulfide reductase family protein [Thermoflexus sp.]MCS7351945.1 TlpA family protein disulfide reductase [Thermoflexus sp.]MCX7691476.1 TlpA family protein disulfide reductase [Thermoflexus sp.]MDW8181404.1 TlpA disulfide reductase family protein [Anaerolineae bacterium]MDW8184551.1 TlpA disulfide reductase family protein [Anaerolineae bacterium]
MRKAAMALLPLLVLACQRLPAGDSAPAVSTPVSMGLTTGIPAPAFELDRLDGGTVRLKDLQGKVVLLNFWATWCAPCREEMPLLSQIYREYHSQGLEILGVNLTSQDDFAEVRNFVEEFDLPFPILLDHNAQVERAYRIFGVPTTVFITREGIIHRVVVGILKGREDVEKTIRPLLGR